MPQVPEVLLQLPDGCLAATAVLRGSPGPSCREFPAAVVLQGSEVVLLTAPDMLTQMPGGDDTATARRPWYRKCPEAVVLTLPEAGMLQCPTCPEAVSCNEHGVSDTRAKECGVGYLRVNERAATPGGE